MKRNTIQSPSPHESEESAEIRREALKWLEHNKGLSVTAHDYCSPRISSEIADCSMPMTFDQYNYCGLGCLYCAVAGTMLSAPGKRKPIEEFCVGDAIYSYNTETGSIEIDRVSSLMERDVEETLTLELENGNSITITPNHPVFVSERGWVDAGDLHPGDDVLYVGNPGAKYYMDQQNPMKNPTISKKQGSIMRALYASGKLEPLREKLRATGRKNLIAANKNKAFRARASTRMVKNNPMHNTETREKVSRTRKRLFRTGELQALWVGKQKPDAVTRMRGPDNPMKDPTIRSKTLRKIVASWNANGRISQGEQHIYKALKEIGANFIFQAFFQGTKRDLVVDFLLPDQQLCLEYDGHSRRYTEDGLAQDQERDAFLLSTYGIKTVRIHRDRAFIPFDQLVGSLRKEIGI